MLTKENRMTTAHQILDELDGYIAGRRYDISAERIAVLSEQIAETLTEKTPDPWPSWDAYHVAAKDFLSMGNIESTQAMIVCWLQTAN